MPRLPDLYDDEALIPPIVLTAEQQGQILAEIVHLCYSFDLRPEQIMSIGRAVTDVFNAAIWREAAARQYVSGVIDGLRMVS